MRPLIQRLFGLGSGRLRVALCVALIAPLALLCGCEAETSSGPGPSGAGGSIGDGGDGGEGGSTDTPTDTGGCEDGATRWCEVQLPTHRNVTNCFRGVQVCTDGEWSPCADPPVAGPPPPADSGDAA